MLSRRSFTSHLLAAPFGAAFTMALPACSKGRAYNISRENEALLRMDMRAFDRNISVMFELTDQDRATRICDAIAARVTQLEAVFSLNNPQSELSRLNRDGKLDAPSDYLLALNQFAREIGINTGGAFNIAAAPISALYQHDEEPDRAALEAALVASQGYARGGPEGLQMSREKTRLDFGSCLSGFTADIIKAQLAGSGINHGFIDAGSLAAIGPRPDGTPWIIDIDGTQNPSTLPLDNAGLSTALRDKDAIIIDPRVGARRALHRNIIVIADRALMADALSSAFSLMPMTEITARRNAILAGGLSRRLDVYRVNFAGQLIAIR